MNKNSIKIVTDKIKIQKGIFKCFKLNDDQISRLLISIDNDENYLELFKQIKKEPRTKICPSCDNIISYANHNTHSLSIKNNSVCLKCAKNKLGERAKTQTGENNPFYGKKHSQESRDKIKYSWDNPSESKQKYIDSKNTPEFKAKMKIRMSGENSPRYKKPLKGIWIKKLGEEAGLKRWEEWKALQKINSTGDKNPMYGKPSPVGSGNGWSGWYKDIYFRSIYELSYIVSILERFDLKWENGEKVKFGIQYVCPLGIKRNYYPDFIIENKYVVEIKPKKLWDSPSVLTKKLAAEEFCKEHNMIYKLTNCSRLTFTEVYQLYIDGEVKFLDRYEEKFKELILKNQK